MVLSFYYFGHSTNMELTKFIIENLLFLILVEIFIGVAAGLSLTIWFSAASMAGEKIAGLDGHPSQKIAKIQETNRHTIKDILEESLEHELHALSLYKKLLSSVENKSVYLEEYARSQIGEEEQHSLELKIMLKDFS